MATLSTKDLKLRCQELEETGKLRGDIDADEIGQVIDFYNQNVDEEKEKDYMREIKGMNKYYWKLAKWSVLHPGENYKSTGTISVNKKGGEKE